MYPSAGASLQLVPMIIGACSSHKERKALLNSRYELQARTSGGFLKLDNGKIIEISSNDGNIKLVEISKISSNFDLEEEDIFCIMSYSSVENYGRIINMRYLFDKAGNIITLKIETSTHCIQINATTSFDGLEILVM